MKTKKNNKKTYWNREFTFEKIRMIVKLLARLIKGALKQ